LDPATTSAGGQGPLVVGVHLPTTALLIHKSYKSPT